MTNEISTERTLESANAAVAAAQKAYDEALGSGQGAAALKKAAERISKQQKINLQLLMPILLKLKQVLALRETS